MVHFMVKKIYLSCQEIIDTPAIFNTRSITTSLVLKGLQNHIRFFLPRHGYNR
ncbi:hypothetical protein GIB67_007228 [Kingdonia uniflora]|uniref:Uncharacterized protein n=1 Tax=Kingdonia uniflora TaxID=39325 RepID=A0A7J7NWX2_9MAGN|nr:hypothetical protein GIB67_007228 [Kingdonia uniflora]